MGWVGLCYRDGIGLLMLYYYCACSGFPGIWTGLDWIMLDWTEHRLYGRRLL
ncbi:hypothetical protein EX30DRAFT_342665 [Ascodesmis nigricans]|uniref:Uncharacterized protein n=1 Tax=Ascodesmis nigricans TaxID=341454 RepID=A0A4S2MQ36_9PEZI|nr:hypothetical protein EX30DRAFT_342665 [Ascodesmis nigricans]